LLGQACDAHDVAFALDVNVVSGLHGRELLQRIRTAGLVHTFHMELSSSPRRQSAKSAAKGAGGAQFIEHGDAIEEPDDVRWFASSSMYSNED